MEFTGVGFLDPRRCQAGMQASMPGGMIKLRPNVFPFGRHSGAWGVEAGPEVLLGRLRPQDYRYK